MTMIPTCWIIIDIEAANEVQEERRVDSPEGNAQGTSEACCGAVCCCLLSFQCKSCPTFSCFLFFFPITVWLREVGGILPAVSLIVTAACVCASALLSCVICLQCSRTWSCTWSARECKLAAQWIQSFMTRLCCFGNSFCTFKCCARN